MLTSMLGERLQRERERERESSNHHGRSTIFYLHLLNILDVTCKKIKGLADFFPGGVSSQESRYRTKWGLSLLRVCCSVHWPVTFKGGLDGQPRRPKCLGEITSFALPSLF